MKPIPKPRIVITGEQSEVTQTIDNFFAETVEFAQKRYNLLPIYFELKSGELAYRHNQITDDRVTHLSYHNIILATVFETRTEENNVMYTFFRDLKGLEELIP
jgi:hypothetical protein